METSTFGPARADAKAAQRAMALAEGRCFLIPTDAMVGLSIHERVTELESVGPSTLKEPGRTTTMSQSGESK